MHINCDAPQTHARHQGRKQAWAFDDLLPCLLCVVFRNRNSLVGHWRELACGRPALGATSAGDMKPAAPEKDRARMSDGRMRMPGGERLQCQGDANVGGYKLADAT